VASNTGGIYRIGVISDTHGLLRPQAAAALAGSDLILHAGDIDTVGVLRALEAVAPVVAVAGNMDNGALATLLPPSETIHVQDLRVHIRHDLGRLDIDPETAGVSAVISGHSHKADIQRKNGVLFLNPGSAGPRRFNWPVTVACIEIRKTALEARLIELNV
jgi:putative phosphoesterase